MRKLHAMRPCWRLAGRCRRLHAQQTGVLLPLLVEGWQWTLCLWVRAAPSPRAMLQRGLLLPPLLVVVVVVVVALVGW